MITFQEIVNNIQEQFNAVLTSLKQSEDQNIASLVSKITNVAVSNTQAFKNLEDEVIRKNKGTIWVVVSFNSGTTNFGATAVPITLSVFGFPNSINPTQVLLTTFVSTYTTKTFGDEPNSIQTWNTPNVFSNFNEVGDHFRSTFSLNGVLILGSATVRLGSLSYVYGNGENDKEDMLFMSASSFYRGNPDPQPFGNTNGFTISIIKFSTDTLTISTYLLNTQLITDAFAVKGFRQSQTNAENENYYKNPTKTTNNDDFKIILKFSNGFTNEGTIFETWKLISFDIEQSLGDITKANLTFSH